MARSWLLLMFTALMAVTPARAYAFGKSALGVSDAAEGLGAWRVDAQMAAVAWENGFPTEKVPLGPQQWLKQGPKGLNPYQVNYWNPVRFVDPDGRSGCGFLDFKCLAALGQVADSIDNANRLRESGGPASPEQAEQFKQAQLQEVADTGKTAGEAAESLAEGTAGGQTLQLGVELREMQSSQAQPGWRGVLATALVAVGAKKLASKVWPAHHAFPKYLGGLRDQTLRKMPRSVHERFHASLDKWKGGKYARGRGADAYKGMDKDQIIADLDEFYSTAEGGMFKEYRPDFIKAVEETLSNTP